MKKIIAIVVMLVSAFLFLNTTVSAESYEFYLNDDNNLYAQMYEDYNIDELIENSPEEMKDFSSKLGISPENPFSFSNILTKDGLLYLKNYIIDSIKAPIKYIGILIALIIVCAVCKTFASNSLQTSYSLNMICSLSAISVLLIPICAVFKEALSVINTVTVFMGIFIPIFAGILIACLRSSTAAAYSSTMFFTCEIISYCCSAFVLPFANSFTALSVASGISGSNKLEGIIRVIKKATYIIITTAMTIFLAVLSMQTLVSSTVDNAATKTAKFFISSFVPIVGASVSETLGSLRGCVSLLKSTSGIYAVIAVLIVFIPVIIKIIVFKLVLTFSADISDVFSVEGVKSVASSLNSALSIILSVTICVGVMFIFSVTILCVTGGAV